MMIPHRMLSPDALRGVIEVFITREGTDYGLHTFAAGVAPGIIPAAVLH
jgi:uncharacterized protein YheU (UPF0270 family)